MHSGTFHRIHRGCLLAAAFFIFSVVQAAPPATDFTMRASDDAPLGSEDGTVTLAWPAPPLMTRVELQQSDRADFTEFTIRYLGRDAGSVITGLPEGAHYFRLRTLNELGEGSAWSEPLRVNVQFMDRGHLFGLLSLGGVVVLLTVGAIVVGFLRHRDDLIANAPGGAQ